MKKLALALALAVAPAAFAQMPTMPTVPKVDAKAAVAVGKEVRAVVRVDVVDTAIAAGKYTTLATALKAADLITALKGAGPFTVFAPDDVAFAKIPAKNLTALLADKAKLAAVLKTHVVAGKITSKDIKAGKVKTLAGTDVEVTMKDGKIFFGGSQVVLADVDATNGVIHGIDAVVLQ